MIARLILLGCIVAMRAAIAGDQRSELKLSHPIEAKDHRDFIISADRHKRVLIFLKDGAVSTLDVSQDFPYSVTLTESPTPRYKAVVVFSDRAKDTSIDSFGITSGNSVERTDDETHKALVDSAAKGRAIGEKLWKEIHGDRQ